MRKRLILINVGNKPLVILYDGSIYESCSLINSYIVSACEMCDLYFVCEGLITSICDIMVLRKIHHSNINVFKFSNRLELNSLFLVSYIRRHGHEI